MTNEVNGLDIFKNLISKLGEKAGQQPEVEKIEKSDIKNIFATDGIDKNKDGAISFEEFIGAAGEQFNIDVDEIKHKEYKNFIEEFNEDYEDLAGEFEIETEAPAKEPEKPAKTTSSEREFTFQDKDGNVTGGLDIRDDLVAGSSLEFDPATGKYTLTFGKTAATDNTDKTDKAAETEETEETDKTDKADGTEETDKADGTEETDKAEETEETDKADGKGAAEDTTEYKFTDSKGNIHEVNVPDGYNNVIIDGNVLTFEYPDGSIQKRTVSGLENTAIGSSNDMVELEEKDADGNVKAVSVPDGYVSSSQKGNVMTYVYEDGSKIEIDLSGATSTKAAEETDDKKDADTDKDNGYSKPDGSNPEYVVNVGGQNISIDIPDELRDEIQTAVDTKTGEVKFYDKKGNEIKAEDINALVTAAKVEKAEKVEEEEDEGEVDKTASLFKKDDRIKTDDKGNKYAEVTAWNNDRSQNNCLFRIIEHSYDLSQMNIPKRADNPNEYDWESEQYLALEKAIMDANPEIYGSADGSVKGRATNKVPRKDGTIDDTRHNAYLYAGDKIILPEAYDIPELGLERPKIEPEKKEDKSKDVNPLPDAEITDVETKNGNMAIDVNDDYFNNSRINLTADPNNDVITLDTFDKEMSFKDYEATAKHILTTKYNDTEILTFKQQVQNDPNLSQTEKDQIIAMFDEEE